jgi:hypothetical protein
MNYSPSSLALYQSCPQAFEFKYISKLPIQEIKSLPMLKGIIVHRILELCAHGETDVLPRIVAEFNSFDLAKDLYDELKTNVLVNGFYDNLFETEKRVEFNYGEFNFVGIIDRINKFSDKEYEVVDYKYGKNEHSNMNSLQPHIYSWAMFKRFGNDINLRFTYYNIHHRTKYTKKFKPEDVSMDSIVKLVNNAQVNFSANPGFYCLWCDFFKYCKQGKEYVDGEIEVEGVDITNVGDKLLWLRERQRMYNFKQKKYEEILKLYFEHTGQTDLRLSNKTILYDEDAKKLVY